MLNPKISTLVGGRLCRQVSTAIRTSAWSGSVCGEKLRLALAREDRGENWRGLESLAGAHSEAVLCNGDRRDQGNQHQASERDGGEAEAPPPCGGTTYAGEPTEPQFTSSI